MRTRVTDWIFPAVISILALADGIPADPPFKQEAIERGIPPHAVDFSWTAGLTLDDLVLLSTHPKHAQEDYDAIIFHELVHVVQYDLLGLEEFMARYVYGFRAVGWIYPTIPLEVTAYFYASKFQANRREPFSVVEWARLALFLPA